MRNKGEEGQALIPLVLAMSIFLIGAVGLSIDGAHLYSQRQMAQAAADAAAQAGIMSIFDRTNSSSGNPGAFSTAGSFACAATDTRTPCAYAARNGFGTSADTVSVDFPPASAAPGVALSPTDPVNLIRVSIQRNVSTTLMGVLGTSATTIKATAMAGIISDLAPVPILITHPTLAGALATNGGVLVKICGGPRRSIQVNSGSSTAITTSGSGTIDLSHAGPADSGACTTGTGADFGAWGGPRTPPFNFLGGTTGNYLQPASPVDDPLADVAAPPVPTNTPSPTPLANGVSGCPASPQKPCMLFYPGLYVAGGPLSNAKNQTMVFSPGIYYIQSGGLSCTSNCAMYMSTGPADPSTGWTGSVLFYNTGAGTFNIGSNGYVNLVGSPESSIYRGILFFQDRTAVAQTHSMGGGGGMSLTGTIYITNTKDIMSDPTHYQALTLQGTPGSATNVQGEIIVGTLSMGGNAAITMQLDPSYKLVMRQVALIN